MHLKDYREADWKKLTSLRPFVPSSNLPPIHATDISAKAVDAARTNARAAGVEQLIDFKVCDFRETHMPPAPGIVMLNPEYGERLGDATKLEPVYRGIGDFLKQKCAGYMGYVFTGNLALARKIGLHSKRRIILYNGQLECRLLEFELYHGTRDP
jgi:putative N6-adenine-specific DNA methylase